VIEPESLRERVASDLAAALHRHRLNSESRTPRRPRARSRVLAREEETVVET
jgi:hypothetical protein